MILALLVLHVAVCEPEHKNTHGLYRLYTEESTGAAHSEIGREWVPFGDLVHMNGTYERCDSGVQLRGDRIALGRATAVRCL